MFNWFIWLSLSRIGHIIMQIFSINYFESGVLVVEQFLKMKVMLGWLNLVEFWLWQSMSWGIGDKKICYKKQCCINAIGKHYCKYCVHIVWGLLAIATYQLWSICYCLVLISFYSSPADQEYDWCGATWRHDIHF